MAYLFHFSSLYSATYIELYEFIYLDTILEF